jgi:RHS repeat-associated protein
MGRRLTETDPFGNTKQWTYDLGGRVTGQRKADQTLLTAVYDAAGRRTSLSGGGLSLSWTHDANGNRLTMVDGTGTTSYVYDAANRVTSVTAPMTGTVSSAFDLAGRRTSLTYPSGRVVATTYTNQGLTASVGGGGISASYSYDPFGRLTQELMATNAKTERTYDGAGCVATITTTPFGQAAQVRTYTYDQADNRVAEDLGSNRTVYTYDALNRLTREQPQATVARGYTYDALGNRLTEAVDGQIATGYTYDAANRMTASGTATYGYDADGRQTSRTDGGTTTTYVYDALDRLAEVQEQGVTLVGYQYNGDGLRVATTSGGVTRRSVWDLAGIGQELNDGVNEYVWGPRGLIGQSAMSGTAYAHADALGSIRIVTGGSGTEVGSTDFSAFGLTEQQVGTQLAYGFTGEKQDSQTGLLYLRARWFDPRTGRFLSLDPVTHAGGMRRAPYAYARNNPLRWTDRSGRFEDNPADGKIEPTVAGPPRPGRPGGLVCYLESITGEGLSQNCAIYNSPVNSICESTTEDYGVNCAFMQAIVPLDQITETCTQLFGPIAECSQTSS